MKPKRRKGKVVLVGAGPGDPGLLTLKGAQGLRQADIVIYDWLVNPKLLELAPQAQKIFVGKRGDTKTRPKGKEQKKINRMLSRYAQQGKQVVRLKGGDPFIFGRGGEEAAFLAEHNLPFEIVPGVSAGIGVPAYAGIPLTDRKFASQVTFVTGHEDPAKKTEKEDWKKLSAASGTLVFFMGVKNLPRIVKALKEAGKPRQTAVAVIEWGTLPHQRVVTGTLGDIVEKTRRANMRPPALTVIGEVVRLRSKLAWFEKKPLRGKTVLVTRARAQASELVERLASEGAEVLEFPTLHILPPLRPEKIREAIQHLSQYDWVIFTSANGVQFFFDQVRYLHRDVRVFSGLKVAAIGEATAEVLEQKGLKPDLIPKEFTSRALFETLRKAGQIAGKKFLLARADIAPPDLKKALEKEGAAKVVELETYRTRQVSQRKAELLNWLRRRKIDYVTFTSSSTVKNFFEPIPDQIRKSLHTHFVSIGPVTSQTLREYGFKPSREAKPHTMEGLVEALIQNGGKK